MLFILISKINLKKAKHRIPEPLRVNREEPSNLTRQTSNKISSPNSILNTSDATTKDLLSQTPTTLKWIPCHPKCKNPLRMLERLISNISHHKNHHSQVTTTSIIIKCKNLPTTYTGIYEKGPNFESKTNQKWMHCIRKIAKMREKECLGWGSTSLAWSDRHDTICWRSWRPTPPQPIRIKGMFFIFLCSFGSFCVLVLLCSGWYNQLSLTEWVNRRWLCPVKYK